MAEEITVELQEGEELQPVDESEADELNAQGL
jgi:hypothetical protein